VHRSIFIQGVVYNNKELDDPIENERVIFLGACTAGLRLMRGPKKIKESGRELVMAVYKNITMLKDQRNTKAKIP